VQRRESKKTKGGKSEGPQCQDKELKRRSKRSLESGVINSEGQARGETEGGKNHRTGGPHGKV